MIRKLKYPRSVAFIICNEFCERFNYYGMRTILVLYLTRRLAYSDDQATVLFHVFTSFAYFFPLIGAIVADSWLGRFKTIVYLSIVYALGSIVIAIGAIPGIYFPAATVTVLGLMLIAVGTGGIKPNVSAFGGDQFQLPEQAKQLATFFSLFYLAINSGSMISTLATPILRDFHCFGESSCFSLAFGVPAALMALSILVLIAGRPLYTMVPPSGNIIVKVMKCIWHAFRVKSKEHLIKPRYHVLDYAEPKYGKQMVYDIKCLLKILLLYIPFPLFWALFDQQSSRWTFQATQMDGHLTNNLHIKPDQMQVFNPVIVVFCIPLFNFVIYPLLEKMYINTPLRKMALGMALCGTAFVLSGVLELELEKTYPVQPTKHECQFRIFNGQSCDFRIQTNLPDNSEIILPSDGMWTNLHIPLNHDQYIVKYQYNLTSHGRKCEYIEQSGEFELVGGQAISYILTAKTELLRYIDAPERSKLTLPMVRVAVASDQKDASNSVNKVVLQRPDASDEHSLDTDLYKLYEVDNGKYFVWIDSVKLSDQIVELKAGGTYTLVVNRLSTHNYTATLHTVVQPNSIHILWQIPQYIIMTGGEIMFSVTGLEFSFTQAPLSMKSVLQAFWLLTVTFGNIFVVIIAELKFVETQSGEFFLYAGLMLINIVLFIYLANRYKYREIIEDIENDEVALRNANVINMNNPSQLNETFTINGLGPATAAIASGTTPRSSVSNTSVDGEKIDSSPKCLKRSSITKNGVNNYGYSDI